MAFKINCDGVEIFPASYKSLEISIDTGIKDIVDAVGADDLLDYIGRDAAVKYWDIE